MKTLPSAVRVTAIAGLVVILGSLGLIFAEGTVRFYGPVAVDFSTLAGTVGSWGICLLAGLAFVWRDRIEPSGTSNGGSRLKGVIALCAAILCALLAALILFHGGLRLAQPGETLSILQTVALPAGLALASALSIFRAITELRRP